MGVSPEKSEKVFRAKRTISDNLWRGMNNGGMSEIVFSAKRTMGNCLKLFFLANEQ
jgi:hypothetical protein